jgi:hypothetical protein
MNGIRHRSAPAERRMHQPELGLFGVKLTHNARTADLATPEDAQNGLVPRNAPGAGNPHERVVIPDLFRSRSRYAFWEIARGKPHP